MDYAPLYADIADGPVSGRALWVTAQDGVRLRIAVWPDGERGTVLLFPGRTEYVEKYGRAAQDLGQRGYATVTIDWRGQGLADRPLPDPNMGHVATFTEYQQDVAAMLALARDLNLPEPFYLIGHSMGGAIGLRALTEGLTVRAAAFSAPMWGIQLARMMQPLAWLLRQTPGAFGQSLRYAPGTGPITYTAEAPFEDNVLTTDREMYHYMQMQVTAQPSLALGGPSIHWVREALVECHALASTASPDLPTVTFLGTRESVVDPVPILRRMPGWPGGQLEMVAGAQHEVMMEQIATRARFFDAAAALFDANH